METIHVEQKRTKKKIYIYKTLPTTGETREAATIASNTSTQTKETITMRIFIPFIRDWVQSHIFHRMLVLCVMHEIGEF